MSQGLPWQGFLDAWRAEWTKVCTVGSTGWLLAGAIALGAGLSAAVCAIVPYQPRGGQDPAKLALTGIQLAQALIAIWAVRAVTGEYRSGMVLTTLAAIPGRANLLAAKAAVIAALAPAAGAITIAVSLLAARVLLSANGFTQAHHIPLVLTSGATLRAGIGSILYLGLVAVLVTGAAVAVRDAAAAIGIVLALLYLFPLAAELTSNASWHRLLQQIGPTTAGLNIQATTDLRTLPIGPWAGLAVLGAWAAGSIILGGVSLQRPPP